MYEPPAEDLIQEVTSVFSGIPPLTKRDIACLKHSWDGNKKSFKQFIRAQPCPDYLPGDFMCYFVHHGRPNVFLFIQRAVVKTFLRDIEEGSRDIWHEWYVQTLHPSANPDKNEVCYRYSKAMSADQKKCLLRFLRFISENSFDVPTADLDQTVVFWTEQLRQSTIEPTGRRLSLSEMIDTAFGSVHPLPEVEIEKYLTTPPFQEPLLAEVLAHQIPPRTMPVGIARSYTITLTVPALLFLMRAKLNDLVRYFSGEDLGSDQIYEMNLFIELLSPRPDYAWEREPYDLADMMNKSQVNCLFECLRYAGDAEFSMEPENIIDALYFWAEILKSKEL